MRLAEPRDAGALRQFCGDSLLGSYILSRFCAYENAYAFARCYVDKTGERIVTALSILEGNAVLLTSDMTDYEELALALPILSVQSLMTNHASAMRLPFAVEQQKQAFCFLESPANGFALNDAPLREVYDLISTSIPGSFSADEEAYLRFLSDFTFRRIRSCARLKAIMRDEHVCACALTAAECEASAVISGVACAEQWRGRGFGKAVVYALANELANENKKVHVIALNDSAGAFYRRIGFLPIETITWLIIN